MNCLWNTESLNNLFAESFVLQILWLHFEYWCELISGNITMLVLMMKHFDSWHTFTVALTIICRWTMSFLVESQMEHPGMAGRIDDLVTLRNSFCDFLYHPCRFGHLPSYKWWSISLKFTYISNQWFFYFFSLFHEKPLAGTLYMEACKIGITYMVAVLSWLLR